MGRARTSSCSSSSSASSFPHPKTDLITDLRLGLPMDVEGNECNNNNQEAMFVKVYMEGIPIGRKLDLLNVNDGYYGLISILDHMFNASILWADVEFIHSEKYHVLTYEDKEGDWLIVGDIPWQMFLASVKRLKITRADRF